MNDQEKSMLLAKAMGLELHPHPIDGMICPLIIIPDNWGHEWEAIQDFYSIENFPLAWRVLNWAMNEQPLERQADWEYEIKEMWGYIGLWSKIPEVVQRQILDKILSLVTKAETEEQEKE